MRWFAEWNGFLAAHDAWLLRVDDAADFERARREGKVGVMLTLQSSDHFRTPDDVDLFRGLGQRVSQLTYNLQNRLGAGFLENADGGLTVFGERIVQRMNAAGMAVDVSHCADRTTMDAIAASTKPVLITHGGARALLPGYLRCKTDEAIRAMARAGGVFGVAMLRFMVRDREPTTVEHVLDHVDHVARLVGVEHVAIGSDMDLVGNPNPVNGPGLADIRAQPHFDRYGYRTGPDGKITIQGLDHAKRVYDLTEGLIARRYADADIQGILGRNAARTLAAIWAR
jgi:membrane dipeptidase